MQYRNEPLKPEDPMKKYQWLFLFLFYLISSFHSLLFAAEDWKGTPDERTFEVGAQIGVATIDSSAGFGLFGAVSKKIIPGGFIEELNNPVFIELMMGPVFLSGGTAFAYSAHLKWEFVKNTDWTFYAVGGLGGNVTGESLGKHFELFPRFGLGSMIHLSDDFFLRSEVSHEWIIIGPSFIF